MGYDNYCWSLSNYVMPLSHRQFLSLTADFQKAGEMSFKTPARLAVTLSKAIARPTFKTDNPISVTEEMWEKANYVDVRIDPVDASKAPRPAWGVAVFKGGRPRQVTFFFQPDDGVVKDFMLVHNAGASSVREGFDAADHDNQSAIFPSWDPHW